jgi:hypothetical protein
MNKKIKIIYYIFYCLFSIFFMPMILIKLADWIHIDLLTWAVPVWITTQFATIFIGVAIFVDEDEL